MLLPGLTGPLGPPELQKSVFFRGTHVARVPAFPVETTNHLSLSHFKPMFFVSDS